MNQPPPGIEPVTPEELAYFCKPGPTGEPPAGEILGWMLHRQLGPAVVGVAAGGFYAALLDLAVMADARNRSLIARGFPLTMATVSLVMDVPIEHSLYLWREYAAYRRRQGEALCN